MLLYFNNPLHLIFQFFQCGCETISGQKLHKLSKLPRIHARLCYNANPDIREIGHCLQLICWNFVLISRAQGLRLDVSSQKGGEGLLSGGWHCI